MKRRRSKYVEEMMSMRYHGEKEEYETEYDREYWLPWDYSQIVGYVEINVSSFGDLKAYYWLVKAKRLSDRMKDRTMRYVGKLFDVSKLRKSNEEIRNDIRNFISVLPSLRSQFKKRHFETMSLNMILDAIDFSQIRYGGQGS